MVSSESGGCWLKEMLLLGDWLGMSLHQGYEQLHCPSVTSPSLPSLLLNFVSTISKILPIELISLYKKYDIQEYFITTTALN